VFQQLEGLAARGVIAPGNNWTTHWRVDKLGRVIQFLEFIIRQLVEFPDEVMLSEIPSGRMTVFRLQMRQTDVGRIIGRNGQTIQAIRALLASSAARHGQRATLEIVE
jgi:predicted RNA-binding protein YlqC (UPF0109 family)